MESVNSPKCDWLINELRIASMEYDNGLTDAITFITVGILSSGYIDPDKKKSGTTKKLVAAIKLGMSFTTAPMPELKLTMASDSMIMNTTEIKTPAQL